MSEGFAPAGNSSSPYRILSLRKFRQAPAVSCSLATKYFWGIADGRDAMLWSISVFLNGTWHVSQDDVPM
jgi:hypothetical protein